MSKEAGLRAMREQRYAQRMARAGQVPSSTRAARTAPVAPTVAAPVAGRAAASAGDAVCGHRSMNGRSCTRELGHTAKNHRYS